MSNEINRKVFLRKIGLYGALTFSAGTLLSACGGENKKQPETIPENNKQNTAEKGPCTDTSGLTVQELKTRETYQYVQNSPYEDKLCDNCNFWIPPASNAPCGTCQLVKGPINPIGYCTAWVAPMKG